MTHGLVSEEICDFCREDIFLYKVKPTWRPLENFRLGLRAVTNGCEDVDRDDDAPLPVCAFVCNSYIFFCLYTDLTGIRDKLPFYCFFFVKQRFSNLKTF
jgi:hypothetical protein